MRFSHHHTILDAQLSPLFVCSCASRPSAEQPGPASVVLLAHAALGALNGLDLDAIDLRDRPLSGARRDAAVNLDAGHGLATSTRATSTRYAALGALNGRNVAIDLGLIVAIDPRHRPRLDRRPRRGRPSSARSSFVRDRLRCGATRRRGRSRRGLPTYCVDLSTVLERGRLVFFSHLRAVSSRCGRLGGFF